MKLDNKAIIDIIIDLRNKNKTYSEIHDILLNEYGVNKSRQSICGLYNRNKSKEYQTEEEIKIVCDVIGIYALGYNAIQVEERIKQLGSNVSYSKILEIIRKNDTYYKSVCNTLLANLVTLINNELDPLVIKTKMEYCGIPIKQERFNILVVEAYRVIMEQLSNKEAARVVRLTGDLQTIKQITEVNIRATKEGIKELL